MDHTYVFDDLSDTLYYFHNDKTVWEAGSSPYLLPFLIENYESGYVEYAESSRCFCSYTLIYVEANYSHFSMEIPL